MTASAVALLMTAASLGAGAAVLRSMGIAGQLQFPERLAWSFALGFGALGWVIFFFALFGGLDALPLLAICVAALPGLVLLGPFAWPRRESFDIWSWLLLAALLLVAAGDVLEAISPPADADSMAYHFALPKSFIEAGRLFFVPRAIDGAAPLLPAMTYMMALRLGGEQAMTGWCMVSGWGIGGLIYAAGRKWLSLNWSLAATLAVLTTPAIVFGGGTGQVEARTAMFVAVACFAAATGRQKGDLRFTAIAGLACGFFMASKLPGLLFTATCGVVLIAQRRWFANGAIFAVAALVAGSQWYLWSFWNTGDPIFPFLYGLVPYKPSAPWNAAQNAFMYADGFVAELVLRQNLLNLFVYPVQSMFDGNSIFEAGRTGFGPYAPLVALFAATGLWWRGRRVFESPWMPVAIICFGFYAAWFFLGTSQRVRHLLPIYPVLVLGLTIAMAEAFRHPPLRGPILFAVTATLVLQIMGQGLFSIKFMRYVLFGETRDEFLLDNVNRYTAVQWINANLHASDKIMLVHRDLVYLINIPVFYAHKDNEARIEIRSNSTDPALFWRQLRAQDVTHILVGPFPAGTELGQDELGGLDALSAGLIRASCARVAVRMPATSGVLSRTLQIRRTEGAQLEILALDPRVCLFEKAGEFAPAGSGANKSR